MASSKATEHATLGKIQGKPNGDVTQFLGVKYAHLKDRFAEPVLAEYPADGTINATEIGPAVLSPPGAVDMEQSLIQHTLPYGDLKISDTEGLNLNISVPTSALDGKAKLPVFVFIHGGGLNIGSAIWPQYDHANLVKLSIEKELPVIGVGINYRLGAPGFLTSKELRDAGYKTNNGLRDQRTALLWVQKHIAGFGGDPDNVSVSGESAGGASVTYMLQSKQPLFKRAMSMSGTALLMKPVPLEASESSYQTAIKLLDLESASPSERMKALTTTPGNEILQKLGQAVQPAATIDNELIFGEPTHSAMTSSPENSSYPLPGTSWCESLLIGDCAFDGSIFSLFIGHRKSGMAADFTKHVRATLPASAADALLRIYDVSPDTADDAAFANVLLFGNDVGFYLPTLSYAKAFSQQQGTKSHVYRFNATNPWDGPWKGTSNHVLDVAFLFQNFNAFLDAGRKRTAEEFTQGILAWANGREPWDAWTEEKGRAMMFGDEGAARVVDDTPQETGRRAKFMEFAGDVGWDAVDRTFGAFFRG